MQGLQENLKIKKKTTIFRNREPSYNLASQFDHSEVPPTPLAIFRNYVNFYSKCG